MKLLNKNKSGFTLVELLIVISVLAVLAGVLVSVLDVNNTKNIAKDAVNIATLEKLAQGIEAFTAAEGRYPTPNAISTGGDGNPLNGSGEGAALAVYISAWPEGEAGTDDNFRYALPENTICISQRSLAEPGTKYKYVSPWSSSLTGGRKECGGRVVRCPAPAAECNGGGFQDNDLGACIDLEGNPC